MLTQLYTTYQNEAGEADDLTATGGMADDSSEADESFESWAESQGGEEDEDTEDQSEGDFEQSEDFEGEDDDTDAPEDDGDEPEDDSEDEPKDEPKSFKIKVDGKELEIPEDKVPQMLQKAIGAEKRFEEANKIKQEAYEFANYIKTNPIEAMKRAGVDFEKLAVDHVYEQVRYDAMSDEEKRAHDLEKDNQIKDQELQRYKDQEAAEIKRREEQEQERKLQQSAIQQQQILEQQMIQALDGSDLPKNKFTVSRIVQYMKSAISKGYMDVTPQDVLKYVESDYQEVLDQARQSRIQKAPKKMESKSPKRVKSSGKSRKVKEATSVYDLFE